MAKNSNKNQCIIEILFFCCAKFVCNMLILNNVFEGVKPRLRIWSIISSAFGSSDLGALRRYKSLRDVQLIVAPKTHRN
jgi:hypothetical protein